MTFGGKVIASLGLGTRGHYRLGFGGDAHHRSDDFYVSSVGLNFNRVMVSILGGCTVDDRKAALMARRAQFGQENIAAP